MPQRNKAPTNITNPLAPNHYCTIIWLKVIKHSLGPLWSSIVTQWKCRCDTSIETEAHLIEGFCPVYGIVREKYDDLENDENLIKMFNEILSMRENLEEEERKEENERKEEKLRREKEKKRS